MAATAAVSAAKSASAFAEPAADRSPDAAMRWAKASAKKMEAETRRRFIVGPGRSFALPAPRRKPANQGSGSAGGANDYEQRGCGSAANLTTVTNIQQIDFVRFHVEGADHAVVSGSQPIPLGASEMVMRKSPSATRALVAAPLVSAS